MYRRAIVQCACLVAACSTSVGAQTVTQLVDSSGDGTNPLAEASAIAVDASLNVFVAGRFSNNVLRITPSGVITQIIDASGDGAGNGLEEPGSLAVDAAGNVFVTGESFCPSNDNAFRITPSGVITEIIDAGGDGAGNLLTDPSSIAVGPTGNVYVTGNTSNNVFEITPGGAITEILDETGDGVGHVATTPTSLAVDDVGNVFVACSLSRNVFRIAPGGGVTEILDTTGDGVGNELGFPFTVAVAASGNVYVGSRVFGGSSPMRIFRITPGGGVELVYEHLLLTPREMVLDRNENLYLTTLTGAFAFAPVLKVTPGGVATHPIDLTGDGVNELCCPNGIATDGRRNVYVTGECTHNAFRVKSVGAPFCFGASGCPCGNEDPNGWSGCANSSGVGAELDATGSRRVSADDLVLTASNIPSPNANGIFFMGPSMLAPVQPMTADGYACTGGGLRFAGIVDDGVPPNQMTMTGFVAAAGAKGLPIVAGATWHFQAWTRDTNGSPCGGTSNLSNAYSVSFIP